jgi:PPOX class probable F420-dependent enzyme
VVGVVPNTADGTADDTADDGHLMADEQVQAFLTALPPRTGKLATVRADGRPHVAPVWYEVDSDGALVFNTGASTVKGRNLQRDPRASICVDDDRTFSFVVVEGVAEISDDLDEVRRWATRLGGRYMGAARAEEYGARNGVAGELVVRLRPGRIVSAFNLAD